MRLAGVLGLGLARAGSVFNAIAGSTLLEDLVSYWTLDEVSGTRADSVGDNDLTDNNTVGVAYPGPSGTVASFVDANTESLSQSVATFPPSLSDFTWTGWLKPVAASGVHVIVNSGNGGSAGRWQLYHSGQFCIGVDGSGDITDGTVTTGWQFLELSYTSADNNLKLYVNGVLTITAVGTGTGAYTADQDFFLGRQGSGSYGVDGQIGRSGFWTRVLTAGERTSLFNSGVGKSYADLTAAEKVGLVSYWNLDETSDGSGAVTRVDAHGDNDLTDNGTTASVTNTATKNGNAASFVAANGEYLSLGVGVGAGTDTDYTISAWAYSAGGTELLWVDNGQTYLLNLAGTLQFQQQIDTTGSQQLAHQTSMTSSAWHHIVCSVAGSKQYLWLDGVAATNNGQDLTGTQTAAGARFYLSYTASFWNGLIDEVAIWNRVLTEDEIAELYASGAGVYYNGSDFV